MNWNKAIEECPSNINGKCGVLPNNNCIKTKKCPIKRLEIKKSQGQK